MIRNLTETDIGQVLTVQEGAYRAVLLEPAGPFLSKAAEFPRGAIGSFEDDTLVGYLFCFPWILGEPFPLHESALSVPRCPTCMYLHDLAVDPRYRGRGTAKALVRHVLGIAEEMRLGAQALVAVQGSEPFWNRFGFEIRREVEYGPGIGGSYMVREQL